MSADPTKKGWQCCSSCQPCIHERPECLLTCGHVTAADKTAALIKAHYNAIPSPAPPVSHHLHDQDGAPLHATEDGGVCTQENSAQSAQVSLITSKITIVIFSPSTYVIWYEFVMTQGDHLGRRQQWWRECWGWAGQDKEGKHFTRIILMLLITKLQFHKLFCLGDADISFKFIHHNFIITFFFDAVIRLRLTKI